MVPQHKEIWLVSMCTYEHVVSKCAPNWGDGLNRDASKANPNRCCTVDHYTHSPGECQLK